MSEHETHAEIVAEMNGTVPGGNRQRRGGTGMSGKIRNPAQIEKRKEGTK